MELRFKNTCPGCPEQYDVFDNEDDTQVGYVRLRHGYMSVRVPDSSGEEIYGAIPKGDGVFYNAKEREYYLNEAARAIEHHLNYGNDFDDPGDFTILV